MTTRLSINKIKESSQKIHFVPCEIQHNSHANVDKYFETTIQGDGQGKCLKIGIVISFRGIFPKIKIYLCKEEYQRDSKAVVA